MIRNLHLLWSCSLRCPLPLILLIHLQPYPFLHSGRTFAEHRLHTPVDKDRSGQIDAEELRQALSQAGQPFSIEASRIMLRMFDQNGSGTITMQGVVC